MSLSSLLMATAHGNRDWVALGIFTSLRFFHTWSWVRTDSGIDKPRRGNRFPAAKGMLDGGDLRAKHARPLMPGRAATHTSLLARWAFQMLTSARPARIRETNTSSSDGLIARTLVTVRPR